MLERPNNPLPPNPPDIQRILDGLRQRVLRAGTLRRHVMGEEKSLDAVVRKIGDNRPTAIARSEERIAPGQTLALNDLVRMIREWLVAHGQAGQNGPAHDGRDLPSRVEADATAAGARTRYSYYGRHIALDADMAAGVEEMAVQERLGIGLVMPGEVDITISFGFHSARYPYESVELLIGFHDKRRAGTLAARYESSRVPLDELTPQEYHLILYYLGLLLPRRT